MRRRTACADMGLDQWIGQLGLAAAMQAEAQIGFGDVGARSGLVVDELAVGPDPEHVLCRAFAEAERQAREVGVADRGLGAAPTALAAGAGAGDVLLLTDPGRPDHVTGHAQRAVADGDRGAIGGGRDGQITETRALGRDVLALGRKQQAADDGADQPAGLQPRPTAEPSAAPPTATRMAMRTQFPGEQKRKANLILFGHSPA